MFRLWDKAKNRCFEEKVNRALYALHRASASKLCQPHFDSKKPFGFEA